MAKSLAFDAAYYEKYYANKSTCVSDQRAVNKLGNFVAAYLKFLDIPVRSVLDLGCGLGHWQAVVGRHYPKAVYLGVEYSPFLCRELGWVQGSAVDFDGRHPHDLVICQGVLQYLNAKDCRRAIKNLARQSSAAVYLQALTEHDWRENADQSVTDGKVYLRKTKWYQEALAPHFLPIGGGLFLKRELDVVLFDLEHLST
jgi:trans-aconitate methyltransferase